MALLWFFAFYFVMTIFCANLFIGVVITLFVDSTSIKSTRLAAALSPLFDFSPTEREAAIAAVLKLNRQMQPYNRSFDVLSESKLGTSRSASTCAQLTEGLVYCPQDNLTPARVSLCDAVLSLLQNPMVIHRANDPMQYPTTDTHSEQSALELRPKDDSELAGSLKRGSSSTNLRQNMPSLWFVLGDKLVRIQCEQALDHSAKQQLSCTLIENWLYGFVAALCSECAASCDKGDPTLDTSPVSFGTDLSSPGWGACKSACNMLVSKLFESYQGTLFC